MTASKDVDTRAHLWVALGNQPGVSTWFSVWSLAREFRDRRAGKQKSEAHGDHACARNAERTPA